MTYGFRVQNFTHQSQSIITHETHFQTPPLPDIEIDTVSKEKDEIHNKYKQLQDDLEVASRVSNEKKDDEVAQLNETVNELKSKELELENEIDEKKQQISRYWWVF